MTPNYQKVEMINYLKDKVNYSQGQLWSMKISRLVKLYLNVRRRKVSERD